MNVKAKREKRVEIKLNDNEYLALQRFAESKGLSMSEVLRDYVKSLIK
jgi:hypothetical protein